MRYKSRKTLLFVAALLLIAIIRDYYTSVYIFAGYAQEMWKLLEKWLQMA